VGYVLAGEGSLAGAIREVQEELGIQLSPAHFRQFRRQTMENRVEDVWLAEVLRDIMDVPTPGPDVADWKWISRVELAQMASLGDFFKYSYLDDMLGSQRLSNSSDEQK
jgi:8-oxo-dGTP pyrophosphatase MutT (NUDIX family)